MLTQPTLQLQELCHYSLWRAHFGVVRFLNTGCCKFERRLSCLQALRLYILAEMGLNQNFPPQMPSWILGDLEISPEHRSAIIILGFVWLFLGSFFTGGNQLCCEIEAIKQSLSYKHNVGGSSSSQKKAVRRNTSAAHTARVPPGSDRVRTGLPGH